MENFKCPICNKSGLPDFTKSNVVCPQCNSDLKAFLLLDSISISKKGRFGIYTIIALSLLAILFLGLFVKSNTTKNVVFATKNEVIATNIVLKDSISNLKFKILAIENPKAEPKIIEINDVTIKYVVKKGDYPYKIAKFFYNDGNKYKKIEEDNGLEQPYELIVGQILKIKIPQE